MNSSAEIRTENRKQIYRYMLDGASYTKQQLALRSGLSVATCNTLLNEMAESGEVAGEKRADREAGRNATFYRINEGFESYLAVFFHISGENRLITLVLFSALGRVLFRSEDSLSSLGYRQLELMIGRIVSRYSGISQILLGAECVAEKGILRHCTVAELNNVPVCPLLEQKFHIPVRLEGDMYYKAYGWQAGSENPSSVVTLACFSSDSVPRSATLEQGRILRGAGGFAGMLGFLYQGTRSGKHPGSLSPASRTLFLTEALLSLITLLNPDTLILTGDLTGDGILEEAKRNCAAAVPSEYMPDFRLMNSFDRFYLAGLFHFAVDHRL